MKDLCLTTFVFGEKYKAYIPLFIYSIKKTYPDYGVVVFCNGTLKPEIKKQLDQIRILGDFKIIENQFNDVDFDVPRGAALRWLLWDESFDEYKAIYVADIDIIYCKESDGIYEQHLEHCKKISKPFSNVVRKIEYKGTKKLGKFLRDVKWCGVIHAFKGLINYKDEMRLTGLHFFIREEYEKLVKPSFKKYLNLIKSGTKVPFHQRGFNDESMLFDMIEDANLSGGLPISTSNTAMLTNSPKESEFRPHHGVHLGIFRNERNIRDSSEIIDLKLYNEYFDSFMEMMDDDIYLSISKFFPDDLKLEIENLKNYYTKKTGYYI